MTVQTDTNVASFNGDGANKVFPIGYKFNSAADLVVLLVDDVAVTTQILTLNSDFTVTGAGDEEGGAVTLEVAPTANQRLTIIRIVDILQLTDLRNQGKFYAEIHEDAFDLLTMIAQQHQSDIALSLRVAETDPEPARIPSVAQRAGKLLAFDADGNPTTALPVADSSTELRQDLANGKSALVDSAVVGWRERTVADRLSDTVNIKDFGAVGDGVADDSAAFEAARDAGVSIFLPVGTYLITRPIVFTNGAVIRGEGDASVIDCSGAGFVGSYGLDVSGTLTQIADVDGLSKGSYTVTFLADPGLQPGDVFVLYNPTDSSFSAFRTNYRAGEFCEVRTVSDNTVTLTNPLYSGYPAGSIQVYKLQSGPVLLRNFRIIGKNAEGNIFISKCARPTVADVSSFHHAGNSGVYFDKCFRPQYMNPNVHTVGAGGDDYGVIFGNCQHGGAVGGSVYSRRHAIATGGDAAVGCVPCRDLRMRGVVLKNDIQSGVHCADFHGNAEDCSYENCTIYGGVTWQGKDIAYRNCTITSLLNGILCHSAELIGGEYLIENCRMISGGDPEPVGRGLIDVGGNSAPFDANTQSAVEFRVRGGTLSAKSATSLTSGLMVRVRGSSVPVRIDVRNLDVTVANLGSLVYCDVVSGSVGVGSWLCVDDLSGLPSGGSPATAAGGFATVPMRMPRSVGLVNVTTATTANSATANVTFRYKYPKTPVVLCGKSGRGYNGNRIGVAHAPSVTTTGATLALSTDDATNFSTAAACDLNYEAVIDEI